MKKPIIGISGNEYPTQNPTEPLLSYTQTCLVEAVQQAGGIPLILPIVSNQLAPAYIQMIDKLILTGGQNVLPAYYGEKQTIDSDDYHPDRDAFELALIKECLAQDKPILGICRGMQLFNVALGGSLHQDIPNHWHRDEADQAIQFADFVADSPLATIYGQQAQINSLHRQAIKDMAPGLSLAAYSRADHIIEAVYSHTTPRFIGVQWHPELLHQNEKRTEEPALFHYFVQEF